MTTSGIYPSNCPDCKANLTGDPVPVPLHIILKYGGRTHFSRVTEIFGDDSDTLVALMCPECGAEWEP